MALEREEHTLGAPGPRARLTRARCCREGPARRRLRVRRRRSRCSRGWAPSSHSTGAASALWLLALALGGARLRRARSGDRCAGHARSAPPRCSHSCSRCPLAFLALVPAGAVGSGLYGAISACLVRVPVQGRPAGARRGRQPLLALARPGRWRISPAWSSCSAASRGSACAAAARPEGRAAGPSPGRPRGSNLEGMAFPRTRMRRLRASAGLRGLVRETDLRAGQPGAAAVRPRVGTARPRADRLDAWRPAPVASPSCRGGPQAAALGIPR